MSSKYYQSHKQEILRKQKEYRDANKEKISSSSKEYYDNNKEEIIVRRKTKLSSEKGIELRSKYNRRYYEKNKSEVNNRCLQHYYTRKTLVNQIATHYGCMNPTCLWKGKFQPSQLDFHHFNQDSKEINVSKLTCSSMKKIATEINKCVVLCKNCHALVHHEGGAKIDESMLCKVTDNLTIFH